MNKTETKSFTSEAWVYECDPRLSSCRVDRLAYDTGSMDVLRIDIQVSFPAIRVKLNPNIYISHLICGQSHTTCYVCIELCVAPTNLFPKAFHPTANKNSWFVQQSEDKHLKWITNYWLLPIAVISAENTHFSLDWGSQCSTPFIYSRKNAKHSL